jgi:energy-coupling factor transport system substrate-specific component
MSNVTRENAAETARQNRWTLQNIITLTVFSVIIYIGMLLVVIATNIVLTPIGALYAGPGIVPILTGPFYMVIATRINKRGVLFFIHLVAALAIIIVGHIYVFSVYIALGVIAELCMLGKDAYKNFWRNCIGFFVYSFALPGSWILPMLLLREHFISWMSANGNPAGMGIFIKMLSSPGAVAVIVALTAAGAVLGCLIGRRIINRHVKKARI